MNEQQIREIIRQELKKILRLEMEKIIPEFFGRTIIQIREFFIKNIK